MILPHGNSVLIALLVVCMLCWGSWPILFRRATRYRFELFYFDFALATVLIAIISAFTLGSLGFDGFNFHDDLINSHKQDWVYVFLAGMIFNFGNMFMFAGLSVAGMTVAMPLAFGVALIVSTWMSFLSHPNSTGMILLGATALVLIAIVLVVMAYSHLRVVQHEALARSGKARSTRRPSSMKGVVLALVGGLVMGTIGPLLGRGQDADEGLGPYSAFFLFSLAILVSSFIYNLFFMNLPVEGDPLEIGEYFKTKAGNHFTGFFGGMIWAAGAVAFFMAESPKGPDHLGAPLETLLARGAPLVAAAWGLLVLKEFRGGDARARLLAGVMWIFYAGGLLLFSCAPLWATGT